MLGYCLTCDRDMGYAKFCVQCGSKLVAARQKCPNCNKPIDLNTRWNFCKNCGWGLRIGYRVIELKERYQIKEDEHGR